MLTSLRLYAKPLSRPFNVNVTLGGQISQRSNVGPVQLMSAPFIGMFINDFDRYIGGDICVGSKNNSS